MRLIHRSCYSRESGASVIQHESVAETDRVSGVRARVNFVMQWTFWYSSTSMRI
jgi:hypothetical protein